MNRMKYLKIIIQIGTAILFSASLVAAYVISRDTIRPIISFKIIWPLNIVPDHYTPWLDVVSGIIHTLALIPLSLFCGAIFGYLYPRKTAMWAILPSCGLIGYFLMSLPSHVYAWQVYYAHAFLVISFICFGVLVAKVYRNVLADRAWTRMTERTVLVAVIFVIAAYSGWLHFHYALLGTRVSGEGFEGIILDKQFIEEIGRQGASSWWEIREIDIMTLEERLQSHVKTHRDGLGPHIRNELSAYRRWYHPELSLSGNKQIDVFLMHGSQISRPQWLHVFFGVAGGGDYYCNMTYNVKDGTFENVRCNADA